MKPHVATLIAISILSLSGRGVRTYAAEQTCVRLPASDSEIFESGAFWSFESSNSTLILDLFPVVKMNSCSEADSNIRVRVDLIKSSTKPYKKFPCFKLDKESFVQSSKILDASMTSVTFDNVEGLYYIRLSHCSVANTETCKITRGSEKRIICIGEEAEESFQSPLNFVSPLSEVDPSEEICEFEIPTKVSVDMVDSRLNVTASDEFCNINIRAVVPLCTATQTTDTVTLTVVDTVAETCSFADYDAKQKSPSASPLKIPLRTCNSSDQLLCENETQTSAWLDHEIHNMARNLSYCLFFKLNDPACQGPFDCVFYTEMISCGLIEASHRHSHRLIVTEPVFICGVSLVLIVSLILLAWTVIQCSKKNPGTPLMSQPLNGTLKKPPRSLTEDDLEHISRLPSQEIVLVYFPDTRRFKELNRKLRNWLITLDVNDVKDIYDEKTNEEVLKNPEKWVRETLAGPEKRIILVCSKLAFECHSAIKRGLSSPRSLENDPHYELLTRTLEHLNREMRGNYRNLICVRYEDLKICSRQYSSESFNLVPGTEYVLPQHLEDICRWIHPRQPNPDCWAETRLEVRDLLDAIRQYRNHDENIFTVQFSASPAVCVDGC